ncbi:Cysteine-rich receptor-like protein [Drosera capensis]
MPATAEFGSPMVGSFSDEAGRSQGAVGVVSEGRQRRGGARGRGMNGCCWPSSPTAGGRFRLRRVVHGSRRLMRIAGIRPDNGGRYRQRFNLIYGKKGEEFTFFLVSALDQDTVTEVLHFLTAEALQYDFNTLKHATENFLGGCKIGKCGFSIVYKWIHAPEYFHRGQFSAKSDVYSFGVLTLEIISGQRVGSHDESGIAQDLLNEAWNCCNDGEELKFMDKTLTSSSYSSIEVKKCIQLSLLCVQPKLDKRPTMASVLNTLNNIVTIILPEPQQPLCFNSSVAESSSSSAGKRIRSHSSQVINPR